MPPRSAPHPRRINSVFPRLARWAQTCLVLSFGIPLFIMLSPLLLLALSVFSMLAGTFMLFCFVVDGEKKRQRMAHEQTAPQFRYLFSYKPRLMRMVYQFLTCMSIFVPCLLASLPVVLPIMQLYGISYLTKWAAEMPQFRIGKPVVKARPKTYTPEYIEWVNELAVVLTGWSWAEIVRAEIATGVSWDDRRPQMYMTDTTSDTGQSSQIPRRRSSSFLTGPPNPSLIASVRTPAALSVRRRSQSFGGSFDGSPDSSRANARSPVSPKSSGTTPVGIYGSRTSFPPRRDSRQQSVQGGFSVSPTSLPTIPEVTTAKQLFREADEQSSGWDTEESEELAPVPITPQTSSEVDIATLQSPLDEID